MTVSELIRNHITETGRDGLVNTWCECGCRLDGLMPCDGFQPDCVPAYDIGETPDGDSHYMLAWPDRPTPEEIRQIWKEKEKKS